MQEETTMDPVDTPAEAAVATDTTETQETTDTAEDQTIAEAMAAVLPEGDPSDAAETDGDVGEGTEAEAGETDLSEYMDGDVESTGVQKRIDKLTAEKYALREKLALLEASSETKTEKAPMPMGEVEKSEYSDKQLSNALKQALTPDPDTGNFDPNLVGEILAERDKNIEYKLVERYRQEQNRGAEASEAQSKEWLQVQNDYDYLSDEAEPEFYEGSRKDLDIKSSSSLLLELAKAFLSKDDDDTKKRYYKGGTLAPGAQRLAIQDALKAILKKNRGTKASSKENAMLKRKLAKTKSKQSLGKTNSMKSANNAGPSKPKTKGDKLSDYIAERKSNKVNPLKDF